MANDSARSTRADAGNEPKGIDQLKGIDWPNLLLMSEQERLATSAAATSSRRWRFRIEIDTILRGGDIQATVLRELLKTSPELAADYVLAIRGETNPDVEQLIRSAIAAGAARTPTPAAVTATNRVFVQVIEDLGKNPPFAEAARIHLDVQLDPNDQGTKADAIRKDLEVEPPRNARDKLVKILGRNARAVRVVDASLGNGRQGEQAETADDRDTASRNSASVSEPRESVGPAGRGRGRSSGPRREI